MNPLTPTERAFVQSSFVNPERMERSRHLMFWAFMGVCAGAVLIVSDSAWDLFDGSGITSESLKTLGFVMVLVGGFFNMWWSHGQLQIARSVIAKLSRPTHCPHCREELDPVGVPRGLRAPKEH